MGCVHTEKEEGSMAALNGLKPEKVFEYFEKLSENIGNKKITFSNFVSLLDEKLEKAFEC